MRAVGYRTLSPVARPGALVDLEIDEPVPGPHDLLVEVEAVSVNPVDTKTRAMVAPPAGEAKVLGWDASGTVREVGQAVTRFRPGDAVSYAGAIDRPGCNSELHLVDARLAGRRPSTLAPAGAAALPLTALTAWELLFDRLGVARGGGDGDALLVVGAAGGVGSVLVQLARSLTSLHVVATAARPETVEWVSSLGAHEVVDHSDGLTGVEPVRYVASLVATDQHLPAYPDLVLPFGHIAVIDDPPHLEITALKQRSVSVSWEMVFTRSLFATSDMAVQGEVLDTLADLIDDGTIRTTLRRSGGPIDASSLVELHAEVEGGRSWGKCVLEGWPG
jgi:zinc-binding alcohol dehydrogenase family protein